MITCFHEIHPSELSSEEIRVEEHPLNMLYFKAFVTARKRAHSVHSQALDMPRVSPAVRKRAIGMLRAKHVRCQHSQTLWNKSFHCVPTGFSRADDLPRSDQPPVTKPEQTNKSERFICEVSVFLTAVCSGFSCKTMGVKCIAECSVMLQTPARLSERCLLCVCVMYGRTFNIFISELPNIFNYRWWICCKWSRCQREVFVIV